jgi:hypothetical protein
VTTAYRPNRQTVDAPPVACCRAGRGSWWLVTHIAISPAMREEAEPVARRVAGEYDKLPGRTYMAPGRTRLETCRGGSLSELAAREAIGGEWGRGERGRPDLLHPVWGPIEVRWTWARAGHLSVRPNDDHDRRYVLVTPGPAADVLAIHGWAFGWEIRNEGAWQLPTETGKGEWWLTQERIHRLPFHKPVRP